MRNDDDTIFQQAQPDIALFRVGKSDIFDGTRVTVEKRNPKI